LNVPKTHAAVTGGSAWRNYQDVVVGSRSLGRTLYFELCMWLAGVPGALGLALRRLLWPRLFGSCGRGTLFGPGVVLRHPNRIHLGARVVVGERCVLDARNTASERTIEIDDDVVLANDVVVQCKRACIRIGARTGLGPHCIVQAADDNDVDLGTDIAVGPRCSILAGGNYNTERLDVPIWRQGIRQGEGVVMEDDIWLGAHAIVLPGVRVGRGSIVAAGAAVTRDVAAFTICAGLPARPLRQRAGAPAATDAAS
jgi:acetyltransferase-like isoleucine patch superfamily enzyme